MIFIILYFIVLILLNFVLFPFLRARTDFFIDNDPQYKDIESITDNNMYIVIALSLAWPITIPMWAIYTLSCKLFLFALNAFKTKSPEPITTAEPIVNEEKSSYRHIEYR